MFSCATRRHGSVMTELQLMSALLHERDVTPQPYPDPHTKRSCAGGVERANHDWMGLRIRVKFRAPFATTAPMKTTAQALSSGAPPNHFVSSLILSVI
jgi:hypothetical protein